MPVARGPEAPAGPRLADRVQVRLPRRARGHPPRPGARPQATAGPTSTRRSRSPSRPPTRRRTTATAPATTTPSPAADGTRVQVADRIEHAVALTMADGTETELDHGHVVIAAITSCTNTSNPSVMIAAGLLARNARRARPGVQAVGEDVARAGLEGRHGVLRQGQPGRLAGVARLPPRRLRLHDVHRQLRAAAGGGLQRRQAEDLAVVSRAQRQPQLRGPDQPRREDELPRVAAAGGRLRAGGDDGHRPARRAARAGHRRRGRLPQGHLADRRGSRARRRGVRARGDVPAPPTASVFEGDERWKGLEIPEGDRFAWDERSTYVRRPSFLEDVPKDPTHAGGHRGRARARQARRLRHHRPHLAGRRDQEGHARGALPQRARRRAARLQLLRLAPRQPRGDGPRHVRQHPPAQPDGAGHRGRLHAPHARRRGDDDLRRLDQVRRGRGRR